MRQSRNKGYEILSLLRSKAVMLENISKLLTGDILKNLCDMGHGDTLVIADGNFPGVRTAAQATIKKVIYTPGVTATDLYKAILEVFPLDINYTECPVEVMDLTPSDKAKGMPDPEIWGEIDKISACKYDGLKCKKIEREEFYRRAEKAFAVIVTGEERIYGNILITKGIV